MELILYINRVIHNTKSLLFISLCLTFSIFKEWEEVLNFSKVFPMIINRLSIINCQWIQISYLFISKMFSTDLISPFKLCSFNFKKNTSIYLLNRESYQYRSYINHLRNFSYYMYLVNIFNVQNADLIWHTQPQVYN